ncbi:hypothetical protein OG948_19335 [Embleya sp. NBC_00888]|uniref:hypothetical protein n=1 Tax=Embleya sp. NBC_00888 TaxID=2975960 RepID=UPI00386E893D|nr:hypothetical protein OG948_19335 [Embleya sp. NBC_00888]
MAVSQRIDAPTPVQDPVVTVLAQYGGLSGRALEAALRYHVMPADTPLTVDTIRELLGVGAHIARRVLRELTEAGIAVAKRLRDSATGRMLGRLTEWSGPRTAGDAPESAAAPAAPDATTTVAAVDDPAVRALALLRSLADVDERLAFKERELRTLVPFLVDRLAGGDTHVEAEVFRELTEDLPPPGRTIKTGLLHYRLTKAPKHPVIPPQTRRPRLVECADCGRPGPDLTPGDLCRHCRTGTDPAPLDGAARVRRLLQLVAHPL